MPGYTRIVATAKKIWEYTTRQLTPKQASETDMLQSLSHLTDLKNRLTEARAARIDKIVTSTQVGTVDWLKAYGTAEHDLFEITATMRELLIVVKEMGSVEPASQVLTFRLYRYEDGAWQFDDSVDVVPAEKDVMTVSGVHGRTKVTMQPSLETQQDYDLPYALYYQ